MQANAQDLQQLLDQSPIEIVEIGNQESIKIQTSWTKILSHSLWIRIGKSSPSSKSVRKSQQEGSEQISREKGEILAQMNIPKSIKLCLCKSAMQAEGYNYLADSKWEVEELFLSDASEAKSEEQNLFKSLSEAKKWNVKRLTSSKLFLTKSKARSALSHLSICLCALGKNCSRSLFVPIL